VRTIAISVGIILRAHALVHPSNLRNAARRLNENEVSFQDSNVCSSRYARLTIYRVPTSRRSTRKNSDTSPSPWEGAPRQTALRLSRYGNRSAATRPIALTPKASLSSRAPATAVRFRSDPSSQAEVRTASPSHTASTRVRGLPQAEKDR